jgi:hypothetical protein
VQLTGWVASGEHYGCVCTAHVQAFDDQARQ